MSTAIEWTQRPGTKGEVWNPVSGCTKVSAGCAHCYAETVANRFWPKQYGRVLSSGSHPSTVPTVTLEDYEREGLLRDRRFSDVWTHRERLSLPLNWQKPRTVFVNSMSDLFHEAIPTEFIDRAFAVMALCPQHTFIVLTKRPARMLTYCSMLSESAVSVSLAIVRTSYWDAGQASPCAVGTIEDRLTAGPLQNVWLGVSVEDQVTADARIPLLLQTPSAVRVVSAEPLLGPLDLSIYFAPGYDAPPFDDIVSWLIVGGESGLKARPCDVAWIRALVSQAKAADVPCFVKQLGACPIVKAARQQHWDWRWLKRPEEKRFTQDGALWRVHTSDRKGADSSEWPVALRVREWPDVGATP